jgi:putative methyltransferase (TIGR04325 family)
MVKSATGKNLNNEELHFISSIDEINFKIDFLHSCSALQYVPEPYTVMEDLLNLSPDWIFFYKMMFNQNDRDFTIVQKSFLSANGPGPFPGGYSDKVLAYPITFMSFNKFNNKILEKFKLEWVFTETTWSHQINEQPISGKGLLYNRQ